MKIAIYISLLSRGGAERKAANIADYMYRQGNEVVLINMYRSEKEYEVSEGIKRITSEPLPEELPGGRIGNFITRFNRLRSIWKSERPDVVLSFIGKTNVMTLLTTRGLNIPVAVALTGAPGREYYSPMLKFMARHLFKCADAVLLQTRQSMDFFPKGVLKKAIIMRNPVSADYDIDRYEGERDKTIVTLGRVDSNKNHELIIDAFANIAKDCPDWKVYIYGEGPERDRLIKKVDDLGLSDRVLLPGFTNDPVSVLKKAGVFVLSSNSEGTPNALIEAMMLGLPVISTDCPCGGPGELIRDGENGLLIPMNDVSKMQDSLQKIINNYHFAEQIGRESAKTRDIYSPKKVFKTWEELFETLANKGKAHK